jgi:hypothetical protein
LSLSSAPASRRAGGRWAVAALVLLGHGLLLWAWRVDAPSRFAPVAVAERPTGLLIVRLPASALAAAPVEPPGAEKRATRAPRPAPAAPRVTPAAPRSMPTDSALVPLIPAAAPSLASAPSPEPPASAPLDLALRIPRADTERGGLARGRDDMQRQALNDPRANTRTDPTQVLPDAVARAGKGDCMKGEFAGAGMGLLSAPFLVYAAVAGNCRPQR